MDQNLTTILSTLIGGLLVLVANYLTQRLASRSDKAKVVREKIEELYSLIDELELYFYLEISKIYTLLHKEEEFKRTYLVVSLDKSKNIDISRSDKLFMLIDLYVPALKKEELPLVKSYQEVLRLLDEIKTTVSISLDSAKPLHTLAVLDAAYSEFYNQATAIQSRLTQFI